MVDVMTKEGDRYRGVSSMDFADHGVWFRAFDNDDPVNFPTPHLLFVPWFNVAVIDYGKADPG